MSCIQCGNKVIENRELQLCGSCNALRRKGARIASKPIVKPKSIPRFSDKRKDENLIYAERRPLFLKDQKCAVFPALNAEEIHHMRGRQGYADQWAKDRDISLYLDERWWLAVSAEGHRYIGSHPSEAFEKGWSYSRLENLDKEPEII